MIKRFVPLAFVFALGCESSALVTSDDQIVTVEGPLTLTVTDFPMMRGVSLVAPQAVGSSRAVIATAVRYGSLCALAVSGHADVSANRINLHIRYAERLTSCIEESRGLRYEGVIAPLAPGRYEVHILHDEGFGTGESEVRVQSVDVT